MKTADVEFGGVQKADGRKLTSVLGRLVGHKTQIKSERGSGTTDFFRAFSSQAQGAVGRSIFGVIDSKWREP
jgi:hypothetical protein